MPQCVNQERLKQMHNPLVSIIVPVYNSADSIQQCINSILSQCYKNIEVVIVDDGSTDNSPQYIQQISESDPRITSMRKDNAGAASARNSGIEIASGEYFTWVDSDDWISATRIQRFVDSLPNNADIVIEGNTNSFRSGSEAMDLFLLNHMRHTMWSTLIKAELFQNERFHNFTIGEDAEMLVRLLGKAQTVSEITTNNDYHYIYRNQSLSHSNNIGNKISWPTRASAEIDYIKTRYPEKIKLAYFDTMRGATEIYSQLHNITEQPNGAELNALIQQLRSIMMRGLRNLPYSKLDIRDYKQVLKTIYSLVSHQ